MFSTRASGENRRSRIGLSLIFLGAVHLAALCSGFLSPYDPEVQHREYPFAAPTRIHILDSRGQLHFRPFVYALAGRPEKPGAYDEDKSRIYPVRFFAAERTPSNAGARRSRHLFGVEEPAHLFLLGTDAFGRDQFSRMLYGGRISLFSGIVAAAVSLGLGLLLGSLAGFYGSWLDEVIMRFAELLLALPWLYCLLAIRAFLPLSVSPERTFLLLILVIGLRGWARPARLIRGVTLSAKERDYVLASRGLGASKTHLLVRHILPETCGVVLTQAALLIPQYILAEVTLSFLGLGVGEPVPSWGNMLASLQHYNVMSSYWWMSLPGLILIPTSYAYYVLADAWHGQSLVGGSTRVRAAD